VNSRRWLYAIAAAALPGALLVAVFVVPPEQVQRDLARILVVHVPSAWIAYLAFAVTLVASAGYLITRRMTWDRVAAGSAEVGVLLTGLTIALGMIWGKSTWGVWWTWDARLVLTAVMFFVYLAYLGLRRGLLDAAVRARRSAWLGILGAVQIPIVHFSVLWWRTLHQPPTLLRGDGIQMDAPFLTSLLISLAAFTAVYAALVVLAVDRQRAESELADLMASEEVEVAGAAVRAPDLGEAG